MDIIDLRIMLILTRISSSVMFISIGRIEFFHYNWFWVLWDFGFIFDLESKNIFKGRLSLITKLIGEFDFKHYKEISILIAELMEWHTFVFYHFNLFGFDYRAWLALNYKISTIKMLDWKFRASQSLIEAYLLLHK